MIYATYASECVRGGSARCGREIVRGGDDRIVRQRGEHVMIRKIKAQLEVEGAFRPIRNVTIQEVQRAERRDFFISLHSVLCTLHSDLWRIPLRSVKPVATIPVNGGETFEKVSPPNPHFKTS